MPFASNEQTGGPLTNREAWIMFAGIFLVFSGGLVVFGSHYDLVKLGAPCSLVGLSLFLFPEYLRWRLWPFVALFLALGIIGIVLAPSEVGIMCIIAATALLLWLVGLWCWKVTRPRRA